MSTSPGALDLTSAVVDSVAVAVFLIGAAVRPRPVRARGSPYANPRIPKAVAEALALVRPTISVQVLWDGSTRLTSVVVAPVNLSYEVPYLISEGPIEGQRTLDGHWARPVPTVLAEARMRDPGLADDELRARPQLAVQALPAGALDRDAIAALAGSSRLDPTALVRLLVSLGAVVAAGRGS